MGLSNLHYRVDIGKGSCKDIALLSNLLTCEPPKDKPDVIKTGNYKKNAPRIFVSARNRRLLASDATRLLVTPILSALLLWT